MRLPCPSRRAWTLAMLAAAILAALGVRPLNSAAKPAEPGRQARGKTTSDLHGDPLPAGGDANKQDLEAIQGTWIIVEAIIRGEKVPKSQFVDLQVVFEGNKMLLKRNSKIDKEGVFKLDARKKPKTFDMDGIFRAIYSLEKNTLKICEYHMAASQKNEKRPAEFSSTKENGCDLTILERKKP